PAAVISGHAVTVELRGEHLSGIAQVWTSFPARVQPVAPPDDGATNRPRFVIEAARGWPVGIGALRVITTNGVSNVLLLMVDDLPSMNETSTNHTMASAQELTLPAAVDGAGDALLSDFFKFTARKGQTISVEAVAQRIGSAMDPIVRLLDANG